MESDLGKDSHPQGVGGACPSQGVTWECLSFQRGQMGVPVLPKGSNWVPVLSKGSAGDAGSSHGVKWGCLFFSWGRGGACPSKGVYWGCPFFQRGQMGCLSFQRGQLGRHVLPMGSNEGACSSQGVVGVPVQGPSQGPISFSCDSFTNVQFN